MTREEARQLAIQAASNNRRHRLAAYSHMRHYPTALAARILEVTPRTIQRYEAELRTSPSERADSN